jgi:DMSO/TMAO reductase YedYZ molybdopterin-dependent catalytic subunit
VARVGRVLGIMFAVCFVTGLISHYEYHPWHWLPIPATPSWGYRLTQGTHVITGIAILPLLLVKLWTVYPKLFQWPPVRSALHALERLSVGLLVASALVEVVIGFLNILQWYPWKWSFLFVHYTLAYVAVGAVLLHIAVKLPTIRDGLATPIASPRDVLTLQDQPVAPEDAHVAGLSRRGLITAAAAGVAVVATVTVGQVVTPLAPVALLAPRRPRSGPLGIPINRTAEQAGTTRIAVDPSWRLSVLGPRSFMLTIDEMEGLDASDARLPIACVEGWSAAGRWRGPALIDIVTRAGGDADSRIEFESLERAGAFRKSVLAGPQVARALLATHLNGHRLTVDHGYPLRLIAPDHPGVFNTKWLQTIRIR